MKQEEKPEKAANSSKKVKPTTKPRKVAGKVCPICKKSFEGDTSHVNRHMKAVHYKIKDFKCEIPGQGEPPLDRNNSPW